MTHMTIRKTTSMSDAYGSERCFSLKRHWRSGHVPEETIQGESEPLSFSAKPTQRSLQKRRNKTAKIKPKTFLPLAFIYTESPLFLSDFPVSCSIYLAFFCVFLHRVLIKPRYFFFAVENISALQRIYLGILNYIRQLAN